MVNQFVVCGILKEKPIVLEESTEGFYAVVNLEIKHRERTIDFVAVYIDKNICDFIEKESKLGDMIAAKGYIITKYDTENENLYSSSYLVGEKLFVMEQ